VGEITENSIAKCSSLSESWETQPTGKKIIHQGTAILYSIEILSYFRYNLEPVLESSDMILYWDRTVITEKTVDFNSFDQQGE
jgi:hypothetical protein